MLDGHVYPTHWVPHLAATHFQLFIRIHEFRSLESKLATREPHGETKPDNAAMVDHGGDDTSEKLGAFKERVNLAVSKVRSSFLRK